MPAVFGSDEMLGNWPSASSFAEFYDPLSIAWRTRHHAASFNILDIDQTFPPPTANPRPVPPAVQAGFWSEEARAKSTIAKRAANLAEKARQLSDAEAASASAASTEAALASKVSAQLNGVLDMVKSVNGSLEEVNDPEDYRVARTFIDDAKELTKRFNEDAHTMDKVLSDPWKQAIHEDAKAVNEQLIKAKKSTGRAIHHVQEVMRKTGMHRGQVHPTSPRKANGRPYWPDKPPEHPLRPYLMADVGQWPQQMAGATFL